MAHTQEPGTPEAREQGCACPYLDNKDREFGKYGSVISKSCQLHFRPGVDDLGDHQLRLFEDWGGL